MNNVTPNAVNLCMSFRTCKGCGETKPTTRTNFGTKTSGLPKAECRACYRARAKAHGDANPERRRERARERKARLENIGVVNEHLQFRPVLFRRQNGACYFCAADLDPESFDIDHLKPVSRGGNE